MPTPPTSKPSSPVTVVPTKQYQSDTKLARKKKLDDASIGKLHSRLVRYTAFPKIPMSKRCYGAVISAIAQYGFHNETGKRVVRTWLGRDLTGPEKSHVKAYIRKHPEKFPRAKVSEDSARDPVSAPHLAVESQLSVLAESLLTDASTWTEPFTFEAPVETQDASTSTDLPDTCDAQVQFGITVEQEQEAHKVYENTVLITRLAVLKRDFENQKNFELAKQGTLLRDAFDNEKQQALAELRAYYEPKVRELTGHNQELRAYHTQREQSLKDAQDELAEYKDAHDKLAVLYEASCKSKDDLYTQIRAGLDQIAHTDEEVFALKAQNTKLIDALAAKELELQNLKAARPKFIGERNTYDLRLTAGQGEVFSEKVLSVVVEPNKPATFTLYEADAAKEYLQKQVGKYTGEKTISYVLPQKSHITKRSIDKK